MLHRPSRIPATAVVPCVIAAIAVLFVALQVHGYTRLSPIDELQHIDYLYRAPSAPAPADRVGQEAMRQQDCRGVDAVGFDPGPCRPVGGFDPATFQEKGYNTAAANSPLYYTLTRGVAEALRLATPADDLVTAGRLTGGLWFGLGLLLTYLAGRRRGIGRGALGAVLLLLAATPALIFPSATITPDALGLASGALLVLALTRWEERPGLGRGAVLTAVAFGVTCVKMTNLVGVAAVAFHLLLLRDDGRARSGTNAGRRANWLTSAAMGGTSLAAAAAWMLFVSSRPQIPADDLPDMVTRFHSPAFPWNGLLENSLVLLQPLSSPWMPVGSPQLTNMSTALATLLLVAGTLAAALFATAPRAETSLSRAVVVAAVAGSVLLVTVGYLSSASYFALPPRYGIALTAPMAIVTAASLRSRSGVALFGGIAVVAAIFTAIRLTALS